MSERRVSSGFGALTAALLLGGITFLAAPPAQADIFDDLEGLFGELACVTHEAIIDANAQLCVELGCDPDAGDCTKLCKAAAKGCVHAGNSIAKLLSALGKAELKAAKLLCRTATNPKACKQGVKEASKAIKAASKLIKQETKASCTDTATAAACSDACNEVSPFPTCQPV